MKREKRPWILLYLLVGVLALSTGLNFYFLLELDDRVWGQELTAELQIPAAEAEVLTGQRPPPAVTLPDTARPASP